MTHLPVEPSSSADPGPSAAAPSVTVSALEIREIPVSLIPPLRHENLWPQIPLDSQLEWYDYEPTTLHFGAFIPVPTGSTLSTSIPEPTTSSTPGSTSSASPGTHAATPPSAPIGVLTLTRQAYPRPLDTLPADLQAQLSEVNRHIQLRKFAVAKRLQGRGVGRKLLLHAIAAAEQEPTLFHFNARIEQRGFYERMGLRVLHDEVYVQRGPTGAGPGKEHLHMGTILGLKKQEQGR